MKKIFILWIIGALFIWYVIEYQPFGTEAEIESVAFAKDRGTNPMVETEIIVVDEEKFLVIQGARFNNTKFTTVIRVKPPCQKSLLDRANN